MRLGTETNSLTNHVLAAAATETPAIGTGATILAWTDRYAGTVVAVSRNGQQVQVQEDRATRVDANGMSEDQTYHYARNPHGRVWTFVRTTAGWRERGTRGKGYGLLVGDRLAYRDFSF